ncbi:MAG TPA: succinate dehydrogenase, cytochrome b556 subunit [bacterium]|nr:succinate dehydrogenase, cytochrome b556 subunit [bacterium]
MPERQAAGSAVPHPPRLAHHLGVRGWAYAGRYPVERYLFLLHRISGVALILYLPVHIWFTAQRLAGPAAWDATMRVFDRPVFVIGEFLILAAFVFHALNGIRLVLAHFGVSIGRPIVASYPYPVALHRGRVVMWTLMVLAAGLIGISAVEIILAMLGHG